ncbi:MAG: hypothetical protein AB1896_02255 [Thermodesulfobacteriota bacterium]
MARRMIVLLFSLTILSGCSLLGWWTDPDFISDLKFKVAVMPFTDAAGVGGPPVEWNTARLVTEELAKNDRLLVIPFPQVQAYLAANNISPPLSQETAVMVGRAMGLNAVVIGSFAEMSQEQKREGWRKWFSFVTERQDYVITALVGNVVDVESGTLLGAKVGAGEVRTGQVEDELMIGNPTSGVPQEKMAASVDEAIAALAENIVQALSLTPWKGLIVQAEAENAVLNAGADVGLSPGDRFVVYAPGQTIVNEVGQTYTVPGPVKAKLEAVNVEAHTAVLKIVEGQVQTGDAARHVK